MSETTHTVHIVVNAHDGHIYAVCATERIAGQYIMDEPDRDEAEYMVIEAHEVLS